MAEEIIRYGAGGVPYKGGAPKPKEKKEEEQKPFKPFLNPDSKPKIPASKPTVSASVKQMKKGVENED